MSKVDTDLSKDIWLGKPLPWELGLFIMGLKPPLLDDLEVGGGGPPLKKKIKGSNQIRCHNVLHRNVKVNFFKLVSFFMNPSSYKSFFLRSNEQCFTQIYMNCIFSS